MAESEFVDVVTMGVDGRVSIDKFRHQTNDLIGRNAVAVVAGKICPIGTCGWCDHLRRRCQSRRLA